MLLVYENVEAFAQREVGDYAQSFFFAQDYCNVSSGGDENRRQRCRRAGALAKQIVAVPKTTADSWAYDMEHELDRHLVELSQPAAE
jgi:hypothetical protein